MRCLVYMRLWTKLRGNCFSCDASVCFLFTGIDCTGPLCRWIGSLGYHPHPLFCDAYYLCQKVGNHYKKLFKWCETGTVWHHDITACDHPNNVHINSSCTTRPIVQGDDPQFTTKSELKLLRHPSRHETLNQCWLNVGLSSTTLDQR